MLHQEINLYENFQKTSQDISFISGRIFWFSLLTMVIFCCFLYAASRWEIINLIKQKNVLEHQAVELQKYFISLKQSYPDIFFSQDVKVTVEKLEDEVKAQQKLIRTISDNDVFSNDLIALG